MRRYRVALVAWGAFAVVVWNVTFDWAVDREAFAFVRAQAARQAQGVPLATLNEAFRPRVRQAAVRSTGWTVLVLVLGAGGTWFARAGRPLADDTFAP